MIQSRSSNSASFLGIAESSSCNTTGHSLLRNAHHTKNIGAGGRFGAENSAGLCQCPSLLQVKRLNHVQKLLRHDWLRDDGIYPERTVALGLFG